MTTRQYQTASYISVSETGARQYQSAFHASVDETIVAATSGLKAIGDAAASGGGINAKAVGSAG